MKEERIFPFCRKTAYNIVSNAFPDLYPNYFRMNRMLQQGGYYPTTKRTKHAKEWIEIKKKCISAFGGMCPITGRSDKLHVHHIDFDRNNNNPENLIPLWAPLHRVIHAIVDFNKAWCEK